MTKTICDKCDQTIEQESKFDFYECNFIHKSHTHISGSPEKFSMDLCKKCSNNLFIILDDHGYITSHSDWGSL